jgi:uncharacterized heparinase superfamily protein
LAFFLKTVETYFHTIKYIKLSQIYFRVKKRFGHPAPHIKITYNAGVTGKWLSYPLYDQKIFKNLAVEFLNAKGSVCSSDDWNDESKDKLWLYNLHYFEDLCAIDGDVRESQQLELIERWILENPAPIGNGWEPYPSSLRIVNWIKFFLSNDVPAQFVLNSLAQQADFLLQNLERHILGNHLFSNAKALIFAGLYLDGTDADKWLRVGLEIYENELDEQVLDDGGNFELSPMYHSIMLVDLLDLINIFTVYPLRISGDIIGSTQEAASKMLGWLQVMMHEDGEISFFNDAAIGIAAKPSRIYEYASLLSVELPKVRQDRLITLAESGYSRINMLSHAVYFDHAMVGPDYLPGHAHADSLSLEWSVGKQRVLVNSGTSMYGVSNERLSQRGTSAHNTVVVEGENSSEVWSGFRVARRAYTSVTELSEVSNKVKITASHNGYQRLKGKVTHTRSIEADDSGMEIKDELLGKWNTAEAMYHLHPDIRVEVLTEHSVRFFLLNEQIILVESSGEIIVSEGYWYPKFGVSVPNKHLKIVFGLSVLNTSFSFKG